jgi:hypothetical protein
MIKERKCQRDNDKVSQIPTQTENAGNRWGEKKAQKKRIGGIRGSTQKN